MAAQLTLLPRLWATPVGQAAHPHIPHRFLATAAAVSVTTDVGCPTQVLDLTRSANQLPPYHPAKFDKNYVFSTSTHSYTRNADPNASANHGIFLKQKLSNLPSSAEKDFATTAVSL